MSIVDILFQKVIPLVAIAIWLFATGALWFGLLMAIQKDVEGTK